MQFRYMLATIASAVLLMATNVKAAGELNLYSSRHYDTDERLYSNFEKATGIKINRLEDKADALIARIKAEGANSPADILLTVDAGRLWRADQAGILDAVQSDILDLRIPEWLRHPQGHWFGFSQRFRIIFYDMDKIDPSDIQTYESLADPKLKGQVCTRSSGNIYMLSLMSAIVEHNGAEAAQGWANGLWNNRARDPSGGDSDQLRGIASGECAVAVSNTYYFSRALRKGMRGLDADDLARIGWVFPNQTTTGAHANISGAGVIKTAPNKANAIKFLEYLASDEAQQYFSSGNDEYPAVAGVGLSDSVAKLGMFRSDTVNLKVMGENQPEAQKIYDRAGYK
ncbi:MAG: extracellular solute-binding protein [Gammaproteobacteria bacterium]|nr:extracellular solute-binding protein [Gammaproteobacteria bacterium]NNJ72963.1 extracellular solute-binding protein [Enterobacterales bacterium]